MNQRSLSRRSVLRSAGVTTGALALPGTALAGTDRTVDFDLDPTAEAYRRHRWTVRHGTGYERNSTFYDPEDDPDSPRPPVYRGMTHTQCRLIDVNWMDTAPPNPGASDGSWRYTFLLNSEAKSIYPKSVERVSAHDGGGYRITSDDKWTLAKKGDNFQQAFDTCNIGSHFGVYAPEPTDEPRKADNVAIGVRRTPNLLRVSNPYPNDVENCDSEDGAGRRMNKRGCATSSDNFMVGLAKLTATRSGVPGVSYVNYRPLWDRIPVEKQDEPLVQAMALMTLSQIQDRYLQDTRWEHVDLDVLPDRVSTALGVAGDLFSGLKAILELTDDPPEVEMPYYRGFAVKKAPGGRGPISSHQAVFDVYVTPNAETNVTVFSGHKQTSGIENQAPHQYLNFSNWELGFDTPRAPTSTRTPSMGELFGSATVNDSFFFDDEWDDSTYDRWNLPDILSIAEPTNRTETPVPLVRWQTNPLEDPENDTPTFGDNQTLRLDAMESIGWRQPVREYHWVLEKDVSNRNTDGHSWAGVTGYEQHGSDPVYELDDHDLTPGTYRFLMSPGRGASNTNAIVPFRLDAQNDAPTAEITSSTMNSVSEGESVTLEGRGSDEESSVSLSWHSYNQTLYNPGYGPKEWLSRGSGTEATFSPETLGTHKVRLTATDAEDANGYDYAYVEVTQ